jgi:myo-inositol-1(or 4)-monophosphatase
MLERVIDATRSAGRLIEEIRLRGFEVHQKGHQGPVTEADHAADSLLKNELLSLEDCGWLSEETADDRSRLDQRRLWVVDPLDGTKEFVRGVPEYSVAVALVEAGRPVLGVVHNPANGDTFWAERGGGAFKNGEPIRVAEGKSLLASRSEIKRGEFAPFMKRDWEITHCGSIEYKLALIASGAGAATLSRGPKWEWDVCAGAVIVEEAGGLATDVFGNPFAFNQFFAKVKGVLAGAPAAYRRALDEAAAMGVSDRMNEFADVGDRGEA